MKKVIKNKKGFTLVELIVCIAIIAILAAVLVPALMGYIKKSNLSKAKSNVQSAYTAVSTYISDCEVANKAPNADIKQGLEQSGKAKLDSHYTVNMKNNICESIVYENGNVRATLTAATGNVELQYKSGDKWGNVDDNGDPKADTPAGGNAGQNSGN